MAVGKTIGNLKLRSGPGMEFEPPIDYLEPDTLLEILEDKGEWLHVRVPAKGFKEGYVGKTHVQIDETAPDVAKKVTGTAKEDDDFSNLSKSRNLG